MVIKPLSREVFEQQLQKSEEVGDFSRKAVSRFYDWMYSDQDGHVQVCAFPVPVGDSKDVPENSNVFDHAANKKEFVGFCNKMSGLWRYQVYSGVNVLSEVPEKGRGTMKHIDHVNTLTLDIETERESYSGAPPEHVWWSYQYALAQAKYINTEYGVWPMVVMSENGIHLHYKVDFPVRENLLHGRQHKYSKYITQQAMNNRYVSKIEQLAPNKITFAPDDVSDLPRVMKVPGTLGIKSQKGRLCGIIHGAKHSECGVITEDQIDDNELPDFGSSSKSEPQETVSLEPTPEKLNADLKSEIQEACNEDQLFKAFWLGKTLTYDSRSHAEFAFIKKLLSMGFTQSEIQQVMEMSGMTKWSEERDHYKEKTLTRAMEEFDGEVTLNRDRGSFSFRRV